MATQTRQHGSKIGTMSEAAFRRAWKKVADTAMTVDLYDDGRHHERAGAQADAELELRQLLHDVGMTDNSIAKVVEAAALAGQRYAAAFHNEAHRSRAFLGR